MNSKNKTPETPNVPAFNFGNSGFLKTVADVNQQEAAIKQLQMIQPWDAEEEKTIAEANRILAAVLTAHIDGEDPFIDASSGLVKHVQMIPPLGGRFKGKLTQNGANGTFERLADIQVSIVRDPTSDEAIALCVEKDDYIRTKFAVMCYENYYAPTTNIRIVPRPVPEKYARMTKLWIPDHNLVQARRDQYAEGKRPKDASEIIDPYAPYTDVFGKFVDIARQMSKTGLLKLFGQRLWARTEEEEKRLLTDLRNFDGDKMFPEVQKATVERRTRNTTELPDLAKNSIIAQQDMIWGNNG